MKVTSISGTALIDRLQTGDFQIALLAVSLSPDGNQTALFSCDAANSGLNFSHYCSEQWDQLDQEQRVEFDANKRTELLVQQSATVWRPRTGQVHPRIGRHPPGYFLLHVLDVNRLGSGPRGGIGKVTSVGRPVGGNHQSMLGGQFDRRRGVYVGSHGQMRSSRSSSSTSLEDGWPGRRGCGGGRSSNDRVALVARPASMSSSNLDATIGTIRATGRPRSVTVTTSPAATLATTLEAFCLRARIPTSVMCFSVERQPGFATLWEDRRSAGGE